MSVVDRIGRLIELVESDLGLRVEATQATRLVTRHGDAVTDDVVALAPELTVGETYFYRHAEQLHAYRDAVLPERRAVTPRVRVLSAGCSTGEEAYTLAMLAPDAGAEITGIDINPRSLERAARGRYSRWALRALPPDLERRWFTKAGADYAISPELARAVTFQRANLSDPAALPVGHYDVVFCRNVVMYFTDRQARALVERLVASLVPGGYLMLGHAEMLHGPLAGLVTRESHGAFYYQRTEGPGAAARDLSWFGAIQASGERIEELSRRIVPQAFDLPAALRAIEALLAAEDFAGAVAALEALPAEHARAPEVLLLRAVALTERGDASGASAACDALAVVPVHAASAHYLRAVARESGGDLAGALAEAERATQLAPEFALAHLRFGLLARRTGDRARARTELARAIAALPGEAPQRLALYAGGLGRGALVRLCESELAAIDAEGSAR